MFFSKAWGYAVRALLYLDEHRDEGPILSSVIAEAQSIPAPFLGKVLGVLAGAGIVESTRGRRGGYILRRDPHEITLQDITLLFEPNAVMNCCILGYGECVGNTACSIHKHWAEPKKYIDQFLQTTTLADLRNAFPMKSHLHLKKKTGDRVSKEETEESK
jgi:Rrf2 family protein